MMNYSEEDIVKKCEEAKTNPATFYQQKFINYTGKTKDTKRYYTEIVAQWLLDNMDVFNGIKTICREASYKLPHDGTQDCKTNRIEEIIAKEIFVQREFEGVGTIIDYQTPLKNRKSDKGVGKIDLLMKCSDKKIVYILEFKKRDSSETMLRCVLEAYTYLKIVDGDKLLKDFGLNGEYKLKAAPFVYKDSKQYTEYTELCKTNTVPPYLKTLMDKLESRPFFLEKGATYSITFPCK